MAAVRQEAGSLLLRLPLPRQPISLGHFLICHPSEERVVFIRRNVTRKDEALRSMYRVLKPGGRGLVLEFSKPVNPFVDAAYAGFQALWPTVGKLVVGESESYQYLVDSIRLHPSQQALKLMIEDANFREVEFHNLLGGIAAIHRAVA